jgi:hypothetical protein
MPVSTRPRKLRKGFWAGSSSRRKPSARRPKSAPAARHLSKTEKKEVKTIIASRKELKYCPDIITYDHYDPANYTPTQLPPILASISLPNIFDSANGITTIVGLQTGHYLNSVSNQLDNNLTAAGQGPCMYPLGMFGMLRGDLSTQIDGNEVFFNSGKINLQINAVNAESNAGQVNDAVGPLCFRVLHVKSKKDAAGTAPSVSGDLFRNMVNDNAGLMSDMSLRNLFNDYGINRQRFEVLADKRFKLIQPVQPAYAGTSANQPSRNFPHASQKNLTLYCKMPKKKLRMNGGDDGVNNYFEPLNADFIHYVFVLCCREQVNSSQFSNTGKCWTLTTQQQSSFREA